MKPGKGLCYLLIGAVALMLQCCIHDYPRPVSGFSSKPGVDPTTVDAYLQVSYDLTWENILHRIGYSTKAQNANMYRFVVEVLEKDSVVCHDVMRMSGEEFSLGELRHRISTPLGNKLYQIAVWFENQSDDGSYFFNTDRLSEVVHLDNSTTTASTIQCGYAVDYLDLREVSTKEESVIKELEMNHVGAKFEIVATDIQEFIKSKRDALLQGEEYRLKLTMSWPMSQCFSLYGNNYVIRDGSNLDFSGPLRLPYADYDELKIAEVFIFCRNEDNANVSLSVTDSSLSTVVKTSEFTIPIKRGFITTVKGDFLMNNVGSVLGVDNVWDEEILIEI